MGEAQPSSATLPVLVLPSEAAIVAVAQAVKAVADAYVAHLATLTPAEKAERDKLAQWRIDTIDWLRGLVRRP
jgi:F420-0:gamma-glutamyl ligase